MSTRENIRLIARAPLPQGKQITSCQQTKYDWTSSLKAIAKLILKHTTADEKIA